MNQYIVVFPTSGDSHRDYSHCHPLALEKSIVLNYCNLQNLTWRLSNNCCNVTELFIPTIISMHTYFLCGTLEAVREKAIAWRRIYLSSVTLPLYLIEVPLNRIFNSRFPVAAIIQIQQIQVQIHPTPVYRLVEKWKKPEPVVADGRGRTQSVSSFRGFMEELLRPRDRSDTQ
ncbi:MAG: hypothetical protein K5Q00_06455 [Gammaproteobacteria bacterium]|nr:hypothetical protein [Gammaproteobacteria bacterium]